MTKPSIDSDELTAFVASTLKAIAAGVEDASDQTSVEMNDFVFGFDMPEAVSFDLAVSATRNIAKGGGLKVHVASLIAGEGKLSSEQKAEEISRIAFDVKWKAVDRVAKPDAHKYDRYSELKE
ncbi:hypothetical protein [Stakelama saccharophila]|uniref:Uncharacterized protein n=1 Tax=Stakelama saccharophila TaxID=3075605 RepID=A0ABZ0B5G6_9SPHN|nr:hypothetical protein [Stakelama sp. W311]WNO52626.1 hypothetical protein RPR59_09115 [Stakelama sp. W311]